jgi:hypothetical protein
MSPAPVPKIANLHLHILINQRTSLVLLDLMLFIYGCSLPLLKFIMLCLYPLLHLALLDEELLNFGSEVPIVQVLVLISLLVDSHVWK